MNDNTVLIDLLQALLKQLQTSTIDPEKLIQAVKKGDLNEVNSLIAAGVNVNYQDANGVTALLHASRISQMEVKKMVSTLLSAKADPNLQTKMGDTALMAACHECNPDAVTLLLQAGANVNLEDQYGNTALMNACQHSNSLVVKALLEAKASINLQNKKGYTALMMACHYNQTTLIPLLLEAGADVNLTNDDGSTALHLLVTRHPDNCHLVRMFITAGAQINHQNTYGHTPLSYAVICEHFSIVKCLLEAGADVNLANRAGETVLFRAARMGYYQLALRLLRSGADVNHRDLSGLTAADHAQRCGHQELAKMIKERKKPKQTEIINDFIKEIAVPGFLQNHRPDWLKNPETGRNLELDFYHPELKIGVVYHGPQHSQFPNLFHSNHADFEKCQQKDKYKLERCHQNGVNLIVVPHDVPSDQIRSYLINHLIEILTKC